MATTFHPLSGWRYSAICTTFIPFVTSDSAADVSVDDGPSARLDFDALNAWCEATTDPALKPDGVAFLREKADLMSFLRAL